MVSRAMQLRTFPSFLIALGIFAGLSGRVHAQHVWLSDLPSIESGHYKVDPYIQAAEQLQHMGQQAAIQQLYGLAQNADSSPDFESEEKTVILCRMLFADAPNFKLQRPVWLGAAYFYGEEHSRETTSYTNWPGEPIELVDGIPFAIVYGYSGGGVVNSHAAESFVQYCITYGAWSNYRFTPKSDAEKRAALKKLIASPKWRQPLKPPEQEYLTAQIQKGQPAPFALGSGPLNGKSLEEALLKVDPWPGGDSTNYSEANWKQLCFIAGVIQKADPRTVSSALREYQAAKTGSSPEQEDYDSKPFLLMRIVFDLPERASEDPHWSSIGHWTTMRTELNDDGTINRAWPIVWNNGNPRLVVGDVGTQSFYRYSADAEFLFYKDKFRFRDLSSFKYGQNK